MDIPYLVSEFHKHKILLKKLYENNPRRNSRIIEKASVVEIKLIIKILYLICNGFISLREADFKLIKQSKRLNYFKDLFESKKSFLKILKQSKIDQICILKKFSALYKGLFYTMFNKI